MVSLAVVGAGAECNLLGRKARSQTKQITSSTDVQLKDEGLLNWSLSQNYNEDR